MRYLCVCVLHTSISLFSASRVLNAFCTSLIIWKACPKLLTALEGPAAVERRELQEYKQWRQPASTPFQLTVSTPCLQHKCHLCCYHSWLCLVSRCRTAYISFTKAISGLGKYVSSVRAMALHSGCTRSASDSIHSHNMQWNVHGPRRTCQDRKSSVWDTHNLLLHYGWCSGKAKLKKYISKQDTTCCGMENYRHTVHTAAVSKQRVPLWWICGKEWQCHAWEESQSHIFDLANSSVRVWRWRGWGGVGIHEMDIKHIIALCFYKQTLLTVHTYQQISCGSGCLPLWGTLPGSCMQP